MRALVVLLLSLILALASRTEAVARSEMAGTSDLILCAGNGATTLTLDANGHPVHARGCSHCLAAGVVADLTARAAPQAPATRSTRLTVVQSTRPARPATIIATARAPPFSLA